jgi:hypothetical protein
MSYFFGGGGSGGGSGDGGAFKNMKSIGAAGDYTSIQDMITAGFYHCYLLEDLTLTSDVTIDSNGLYIHQNDYNIDADDYQFLWSAAGVLGIETWTKGTITYGYSTGKILFDPTTTYASSSSLYLKNVHVVNNSSANAAYVNRNSLGTIRADNLTITVGDQIQGGLRLANNNQIIKGLHLIGGGSSSRIGVDITRGTLLGVYISGSWSSFGNGISCGGSEVVIDDMVFGVNGLEAVLAGTVSNVRGASGVTFDVQIDKSEANLTNVFAGGDLDLSGEDNCQFANCTFDNLDIANTETFNSFTQTTFKGNVDIGGDYTSMDDVDIYGTLNIESSCDYVSVEGLFRGNVTVDGNKNRLKGRLTASETCTIASGAANNDVDVIIDQPVVDNSGNNTNSIKENIY